MPEIPALKSATLSFEKQRRESRSNIPTSREDVIAKLLEQKEERVEAAANAEAIVTRDEMIGTVLDVLA